MPLLPLEALAPLLVCPRCRSPLDRAGGAFSCPTAGCIGQPPGGFPVVAEQPVLVDFERSILREPDLVRRDGSSVVTRGRVRGPLGGLRSLTAARTGVAERCTGDLVDRLHRRERPRALVIGGGTLGGCIQRLYEDPAVQVIAFDLYASPWTQFIADGHHVPLADGCIDAVFVQAVLEHVLDPRQVVDEIVRVLGPDGLVYAETPFLQQVHEGPFDFTRFTESGHRWMFRRFERLDSGALAGAGHQLTWSVDYLARGVLRSFVAGRMARVAAFWANWLDGVIPERYAVDAASCVYFYGRKTDREISPAEIVSHYRGAQRS